MNDYLAMLDDEHDEDAFWRRVESRRRLSPEAIAQLLQELARIRATRGPKVLRILWEDKDG